MSTIPNQYKGTGYGTIYTDSELRQAIADAEVAVLIGVGQQKIHSATLTISSLTLATANTEYSIVLNAITKYSFKILSGGSVRFSNVTAKVAVPTLPYYTLDASSEEVQDFGNSYQFTDTLYFASSTAGTVIIFQIWS